MNCNGIDSGGGWCGTGSALGVASFVGSLAFTRVKNSAFKIEPKEKKKRRNYVSLKNRFEKYADVVESEPLACRLLCHHHDTHTVRTVPLPLLFLPTSHHITSHHITPHTHATDNCLFVENNTQGCLQ